MQNTVPRIEGGIDKGFHYTSDNTPAPFFPVVNQIELSIYCTRAEVVEYCKNEGILVETYFPATRGDKLERSNVVELAQR